MGKALSAADNVSTGLGVQQQGNNKTVETQHLSENENQDHTDEKLRLLGSTAHTSVTNDSNGETSSKTTETDTEASAKLDEAGIERLGLREVGTDQHRDDQAVDTDDTGHNARQDALNDTVRVLDSGGDDSDASLGGTIAGTEVSEHNGSSAAKSAEEGGVNGAQIRRH